MHFKFLNLEELFDANSVITSNESVNPQTQEFCQDGIYSDKIFGNLYGKTVEHACECKELRGKFLDGCRCPKCNTIVKERKSLVSNLGWIDLGEYQIVSPVFFPILEKFVGKAKLAKYVNFDCFVDVDGNVSYPPTDDTKEVLPDLVGRGIQGVVKNIDLILSTFLTEDPASKEYHALLVANRSKLLTSKIPVFSHRLRPAVFVGGELIFEKVNTIYVQLVTCNNSLQGLTADKSELNVNEFMNKIHELTSCIYSHILETISGKKGYIRNSLLGSRLNFSIRCVIVPIEPGRPINEIDVPYLAALEAFKLQIINKLTKLKSMTISEATTRWKYAFTKFDSYIYDIMNSFLIEAEGGVKCLLNRNPTIALGSIMCVKIGRIKRDIADSTMSISNNVLSYLAADFDGDTLNLFILLDPDHKQHFESLNPQRLVISADTGMLSKEIILDKDYILGLCSLLSK